MDLQFCPGAVVMVFVATLVAAFITSGGVRLGSVAFCCYSSTRSLTSRSIFGRRRGSDLLFAECLLISASLRASSTVKASKRLLARAALGSRLGA